MTKRYLPQNRIVPAEHSGYNNLKNKYYETFTIAFYDNISANARPV